MRAQGLTQSIEHGFALRGEPTEDEHDLAGDGIYDLTDLLIMQHEVEELGHFQIVHRDLRLTIGGDA
jgi:hypothetical protein